MSTPNHAPNSGPHSPCSPQPTLNNEVLLQPEWRSRDGASQAVEPKEMKQKRWVVHAAPSVTTGPVKWPPGVGHFFFMAPDRHLIEFLMGRCPLWHRNKSHSLSDGVELGTSPPVRWRRRAPSRVPSHVATARPWLELCRSSPLVP